MSRQFQPRPDQVWQKAIFQDPIHELLGFRKDAYGNWIQKHQYGNRNSDLGWEMDHFFVPKSLGGSSSIENLQPVHWKVNVDKSNKGGLGHYLPG